MSDEAVWGLMVWMCVYWLMVYCLALRFPGIVFTRSAQVLGIPLTFVMAVIEAVVRMFHDGRWGGIRVDDK